MHTATLPSMYPMRPQKHLFLTYLVSATFPLSQIKIVPEKSVEGKNTTGRTIGMIEVKKDDLKQSFAQSTVQIFTIPQMKQGFQKSKSRQVILRKSRVKELE